MTIEEIMQRCEPLLKELRASAYMEGYEQGKADAEAELEKVKKPSKRHMLTQQEQRDRVVKQAKADIANLKERMVSNAISCDGNDTFRHTMTVVDFRINREKQTVVALVRGRGTHRIYEKGIAKCTPNDCFNIWIGMAIALRRALGLGVQSEYLNLPQPTEVRAGDIVRYTDDPYSRYLLVVNGHQNEPNWWATRTFLHVAKEQKASGSLVFVDDSRENVVDKDKTKGWINNG